MKDVEPHKSATHMRKLSWKKKVSVDSKPHMININTEDGDTSRQDKSHGGSLFPSVASPKVQYTKIHEIPQCLSPTAEDGGGTITTPGLLSPDGRGDTPTIAFISRPASMMTGQTTTAVNSLGRTTVARTSMLEGPNKVDYKEEDYVNDSSEMADYLAVSIDKN